MDARIRTWLERELETWEPLEEAPQLLAPSEPCQAPCLGDRLSDEEIEVRPAIDDDVFCEFPWGLDEREVVRMSWGDGMPGLSGGYVVHAVDVPGLGTIYVEVGFDGWALLAAATGQLPPDAADRAFLDVAFRTNGRAFHTELIGSPPHSLCVAAADDDWLAARLAAIFHEYDLWGVLDEEIPGLCDSDEAELVSLAARAGVDLDALYAEHDALRPRESSRAGFVAMLGWSAGRDRWIREKLLESDAAREWMYRRKLERYLGVMNGALNEEHEDE